MRILVLTGAFVLPLLFACALKHTLFKDGHSSYCIVLDDGAVLLLDGKVLIERDGSHSVESGWAFVKLEEGFHHLELRYFEDCEGQQLDILFRTPAGYDGPLPPKRLFLATNQ